MKGYHCRGLCLDVRAITWIPCSQAPGICLGSLLHDEAASLVVHVDVLDAASLLDDGESTLSTSWKYYLQGSIGSNSVPIRLYAASNCGFREESSSFAMFPWLSISIMANLYPLKKIRDQLQIIT